MNAIEADDRRLLFDLVGKAIGADVEGEIKAIDVAQWWRVFRLAQQNRVVALSAEALPTEMPREVKMPWIAEQEKAVRWYRHQEEVEQEVVQTMQQRGIETLTLKGTHIASYYPRPELREFSDLDLYFYDKHSEADRVASEVMGLAVSNRGHHHSKYDYRGLTIESHFDFVNTHYPPSNRRYEQVLKASAPSPTFEVLFLLRHMAGHFAASRITLRDLADWSVSCRVLQAKVDWPSVEQVVADYGMQRFAAAIEAICSRRWGMASPLHLAEADEAEVRKVEEDIVHGIADKEADGMKRLWWKVGRWHTMRWKRQMTYSESDERLLWQSLVSHSLRPRSIMHKV